MRQELGNGEDISFWHGVWAGEKSLRDLFPRLYYISNNKEGKIKDMGYWDGGRWIWEIRWLREIREREQCKVEELLGLLRDISPTIDAPDRWRWLGSPSGCFSVRDAYKKIVRSSCNLTTPSLPIFRGACIWKSFAPFKAKIAAWRLVKDRLPTKTNLLKRNLISHYETECCCCKSDSESASHLFLDCPGTRSLWCKLVDWIGTQWAAPNDLADHFESFSNLLGRGKHKARLGSLWICTIWVLWKWRNAVLFEGQQWDFKRVEEEIKRRFWSWCRVHGDADPNISYNAWSRNSLYINWAVT